MIRRLAHPLLWICLLSAAVTFQLRGSFHYSDDLTYMASAGDVLDGSYSPSTYHEYRFGMVFPVAAAFRLFGRSYAAAVLYPMAAAVGCVILAYLFGRDLGGRRTGLASALLASVVPQMIQSATSVYPDVPLAFLTGLACRFHLRASGSPGLGPWALAGLSLGLAFLVKVEALKILPFMAAWELLRFRRASLRGWGAAAAGFALLVLLDMLLLWKLTGTPFRRLDEFLTTYEKGMGMAPMLKSLVSPFGALGVLLWPALRGTWVERRSETARYVLGWFWTTLAVTLYLAHAKSLSEGRYYAFLAIPLSCLAGAGVSRMRHLPLVLGILAAANLLSVHARPGGDVVVPMNRAMDFLRATDTPVYADSRSAMACSRLFLPKGRRVLDATLHAPEPGALVLVNPQLLSFLEGYARRRIPPELRHPPPAWELVFSAGPGPKGIPWLRDAGGRIRAWKARRVGGGAGAPEGISIYRVPPS